ncbi:MAG: ferritin-like domain-containing protein [Kofleriaceae bacterium]
MEKPTDIGTNRTGIATSPIDSPALIKGAREGANGDGNGHEIDGEVLLDQRVLFARSAHPVGTVPPPATIKGIAKAVLEKLQGHKPTVFIDKLGQRLAYERAGVRLYEALLAKFDAANVHDGGPTRTQIEEIRNDEHRHATILRDAILSLGADPTAMTPCADVTGVAGLGWVQVLCDPRTTLTQCLDVMLGVELYDTASWLLLVDLADELGFDELAARFREAHVNEEGHSVRLRAWVRGAVIGQAGEDATPVKKTKH